MTAEGPVETECDNAFWLYQRIRRAHPAASLGYLTDIGFTPPNRQRLRELLEEVSLLCCECTFHAADRHKARSSHHLCTDDVSQLAAELRPKALLPMHLSKTYLRQPFALYRELNLPEATRLLQLPEYLTPRPCLLTELPPTANRQLLTEPATCKEVADD
jgi:ribonuclease Z